MEEKNRVQVKIYGQEFTVSGKLPREHIIKVADHVDRAMHKLAEELPSCPTSSLAALAAVNCADEYFRTLDNLNDLKAKNQQLEKDAKHYVQLWDEAKRNFLQYKEDAQSAIENSNELQKAYSAEQSKVKELSIKIGELDKHNKELTKNNESLASKLNAKEEEKVSASSIIKELESKCQETESSFFDLQMENIRLKSELDRLKKDAETTSKGYE
jgi:cell division protein ZapA